MTRTEMKSLLVCGFNSEKSAQMVTVVGEIILALLFRFTLVHTPRKHNMSTLQRSLMLPNEV